MEAYSIYIEKPLQNYSQFSIKFETANGGNKPKLKIAQQMLNF